jgi:hypothetical protein
VSTRLGRWTFVVEWLIVFIAAAILIGPLFRVKYLDNWSSIESTFIADARFLKDHWPHPNWQPNWYCGTRTDFIYPPALRYGTAAVAKYVPKVVPARAYHLYIAFFYCFGIAAVYLLARWGSGSRAAGALAAAATALVSPSFLFVSQIRDDTALWMPYRLSVLLRYGEGPHISSLAWIPLALLFSFRALERWRPWSMAAAAFCCAMVVSNNFYGATSLAMLFPLLLWSVYITHLDLWAWLRAGAIAALAYGLCAFWLTPSYIQITLSNMQFVSSQGNLWSRWVAIALVIGFVLLSDYLVRGRRRDAYLTFLVGAGVLFFVSVVGNHYLNFRILGEPSRQFPELDMLLILLSVEVLRRVWTAARAMVVLVVIAGLAPSSWYLHGAWTIYPVDPRFQDRVEYQLQDWVAKNMPESRVLPAGSVRFWYNVWNDLPQLGGGSEQGLLNQRVVPPIWEVYLAEDPDPSIRWMQVMGVDAVIVNGKDSREQYHDYVFPEKFRGKLPVLFDNGRHDVIYGIPRRYRSIARVVNRASHAALPVIAQAGSTPELQAWYDNVERGPDVPTETRFEGTDVLHVRARTSEGEAVWVQESYDTNWRAYVGDRQYPIHGDNLGFMVIDVPPGDHDIRLVFPTPFSNKVGRAVTALSIVALVCLVHLGRRRI